MKNYFIKFLFILSISLSGVNLFGQTNYGGLPRPNSNVIASARSGDTLYIGGDFTQFSTSDTAAQYGSLINQPNGRVIRSWPRPNSTVWITIPDGNGGWFIGGDFSQVGDSTRQRVAHINNQGKVSAWKVNNCNNQVRALQLDGNNLYIGGEFSILGDSARNKIAMVNATTGVVSSMFNNAGFNAGVFAFSKNATNLYAGGNFTNYGSSRSYGTALDTTLGNLININYPQANSTVYASISDGNGGWFIAGDFSQVGDSARQRVAHINNLGKVSAWKVKNCNNSVRALELDGNNLYLGGYFTIVGDSIRNRIAEVDATTGAVSSKFNNGGFDGTVFTFTKNNKNIYAGGEFGVYGPSRNYGIMTDTTYGNIVNQPTTVSQPNATVWVSLPDGNGGWFIGGDFSQIGDSIRQRVAHINAQGRVSSWKIKNCNGTVRALQLDGTKLYIGGDFTILGDSVRNRIAEVDASTAAITTKFNTGGLNGTVWSFAKTATNLYTGGSFTGYGVARTYGTILDTTLGNLINTNYPQANSTVYASISDGNGGWFIGGDFSQVGDSARQRIAHINNLGKVSAWKVKNCNNSVRALELDGNNLYIGGYFNIVADSARNRIVEVDATTGAVTSKFNNGGFDGAVFTFTKNSKNIYAGGEFGVYGPSRNYGIMADTTFGNIVNQPITVSQPNNVVFVSIPDGNGGWFIGGAFTQIGDSLRQRLAHINAQGRVTAWKVKNCNNQVRALQLDGTSLYIGGDFTILSDSVRNRIAEVDVATGAVTAKFNTGGLNSTVWSFAKTATNLYAGGSFTSYGGFRSYGTILDTTLGNLINTNYPQANSTVWASISDGNGGWFIAGDFSQVGDSARQRIAHINNLGKVSAWKVKNCNNSVRALELDGNNLYIGGYFSIVADSTRNRIAQVDATTGAVTSKFNDGGFDGAVFTFTKNSKNIYVGGEYGVYGPSRNYGIMADTTYGNIVNQPITVSQPNNVVYVSVPDGNGGWFIGGAFTQIGDSLRQRVAHINAQGRVSSWKVKNCNNNVRSLLLDGNKLYIGGDFTVLGDSVRNRIAIADALTGVVGIEFKYRNFNSTVLTMKKVDNTLYVGGSFTRYSSNKTNAVEMNNTGLVNVQFPKANGSVFKAISDGNGGWYIAGNFTIVGDSTRNRVAHINSFGKVSAWNPNANNLVYTLTLSNNLIYLGGDFTTIAGQTRNRIAAVNTTTGAPTAWDPNSNGSVTCFKVINSALYVGGNFTSIGGQARNRLAIIDTALATANAWNPNVNGVVWSMEVVNNTLYVGGEFTNILGATKYRGASINLYTGTLNPWNLNANGVVRDMKFVGNRMLVAGDFNYVGNISTQRNYITAVDTAIGNLTGSFNPVANSPIYTMEFVGNRLVVGGNFSVIGGVSNQNNIALLDTSTGAFINTWRTTATNLVRTIAVDGTKIFAGGDFTEFDDDRIRNYALAIDVNTLNPKPWDPSLNSTVWDIVNVNNQIFVGGSFNQVNTMTTAISRPYLALFDTITGSCITSWNGALNNQVLGLSLTNNKLYLGGSFTSAGGQTRNRAAAFDLASNTLTAFNPNVNSDVWAIKQIGSKVFLGGSFGTLGGKNKAYLAAVDSASGVQNLTWDIYSNTTVYTITGQGSYMYIGNQATFYKDRYRVAAFDKTTGVLTSFNPSTNGTVWSMAMSNGGDSLYLAGDFGNINNTQGPVVNRNYLAKVDATYGIASSWYPTGFNNVLRSLAISGNKLYVGGHFVTSSGQTRNRMVAFDTLTGAMTSFNPNFNGAVLDITPVGNTLLVGGEFTTMGPLARRYIASLDRETGLPTKWETSANGVVYTVRPQGSQIYAGGSCSQIGYRDRGYAAAFNLANGQITSWNPSTNSTVFAIQPYKDSLIIGGSFNNVNGVSRNYITKVDTVDGIMSSWNAALNNQVLALNLNKDKLYLGGSFTSAGGQTRNRGAAFDLTSNTLTAFNPNVNSDVWAINQIGSKVFLGGSFGTLGGKNKAYLAAVDSALGVQDLTWDIYSNTTVYSIVGQGSYMYIGNQATFYKDRYRVAAFDRTTGVLTPFNPSTNSTVWSMAMSNGGDSLYLAGDFGNINNTQGPVVNRNYLAKVDATYGKVSSWYPTGFNNVLRSLAISGNKLYVGGHFVTSSGQTRNRMVAFDTLTGAMTSFNPNFNGAVLDITPVGNTLLVGGEFTTMGPLARRYIASLDRETGLPTKWETSANGVVNTIQLQGSQLYAGGSCSQIGYRERGYAAAFNLTTGQIISWNPSTNSTVFAIQPYKDSLIIGGSFNNVNGVSRNYITKVDTLDGIMSSWNALLNNQVLSLNLVNDKLYLGGSFTSAGGQTRNRGAAFDLTSNTLTTFNPNVNSNIWSIKQIGSKVFIGGDFTTLATKNKPYLAAVDSALGIQDLAWDVYSNNPVYTVTGQGAYMYVGNQATFYKDRYRVAAFDRTTGVLTPFNPSTNGTVWAMAMSNGGDSLYLGGDFGNINNTQGPVVNRNYLAKVDATYGRVSSWYPTGFNNVLRSLAVAGNKLYVGGHFTTSSGQTRNRMVAFDTLTGAITSFNPNLNGAVLDITPLGNTILIGGEFNMLGSLPRRYIASIDRETGLPTKWETSANGVVNTIQLQGSQLYAGGSCSQIGYRERGYAAAFNLSTGLMTNWNPGFNSTVYAMINSGDSIYVGGSYNNVAGISRNYIGKFDADNGYYSSWNPNANNQILGMALAGDKIYLGGSFSSIGGKARNRIASVDTLTAITTDWNPNANSNVWGLLPVGNKIYAVGDFTQIGTKNRQYIAELDTIVANSPVTNTTGWDASANSGIYTIKGYGSTMCVGGSYNNIGSPYRNRLAAINLVTGDLLGFDPVVNGTVRSIVVDGDKLYVGGSFNNINGLSRTYLSRFNVPTGTLDTWNPSLNNTVYTIKKQNTTLYLGGTFTTINATTRNRIASMDISGTLTSWDPNANNAIYNLELNAGNVYAGGDFTSIAGQTRNRIASFDNTGAITSWNPNSNSGVQTLLASQGRLYVGGSFTNIGAVTRNYLASFDLANGNVNTWNPNPNSTVYSLAADRNLVYIGGQFGAVGGQGRSYFASIDTTGTGAVTSWTPNPNCYVYTIVPKGDTIISGGCYSYIANASVTNLSAISRYALTVTGANKTGVCAGDNVRVYYTITPTLAAGNVFTLQLSDSSGSFANPINIGTLTSSSSDTITGIIPNSITKFSYLYKLRIKSSGTAVEPSVWSSNFTINPIAVASFTANNTNQCLGSNSFVFTNTSTPITNNFTWSFGDASTSTLVNPTKKYAAAGSYQVQLISGGTYCRDTARMVVSIDSTVANFVPNRYAQCEDSASFTFTNTTTPSVAGKTFLWNFGAGVNDNANTVNGQKTYSTVGEYSVKLVVTSGTGCKDSVTKKVNLYPFPATPVVADVTRCGPGTVTFNTTVPTGFINKWYTAPTGGTAVASGSNFTTPSLTTTTNYYVETQYNIATLIGDTVSSARMLIGLRKLKTAYTGNAIKLRRSSDNATQMFGFVNNELDTVAIKTWLGSATPYVEIIYDQSGYGNNMTQTNTSWQPILIFSGHNAKPILRFNTSQFMTNSTNFPAPFTAIGIAKLNGGSNNRVFSAISNNWLLGYHNPGRQMAYYEGWVTNNNVTTNLTTPFIYTGMGTGSSSYVYENSLLLNNNANGVQGPNGPQFNGYGNGQNQTSDVDIFEYLVCNATLDSNTRRVVENDIANRFNIAITPALVPIGSTVACPSNRALVKAIVGSASISLPDTTYGCGDSIAIDAGSGYSTYSWNGGGTNQVKYAKVNGWYKVAVTGGTCGGGSQSDSSYAVLYSKPTATATPAGPTTFNTGGSVIINANTGTGLTYKWLNNNSIIATATSASYTANAAGSYRVLVTNANGCSDTSTAVVVTVNACATATSTAATATTFCSGGSVIITAASGTGFAYQWLNNNVPIATATNQAYTATATGNYRVVITAGACRDTATAIAVTVNTIPTVTATTPAAICGTGTVTLGATASAGTLNWYAAATGGTSLATGTSFTTPSISATTTYYVDATNTGCTTATRTAVIATVNTIPTVTATTPAAICGTGTVTLGATASAGTLNWYAAATGGTSLGTGTSFTTPSISATTTYYVDATNTGCTTATRSAVIATVNAIPTVTATTPAAICGTGTVTLGATASAGTLNWYAAATGGTSLGTGTSFTTPSISATTTYYVDATNTGCTTATRTAVIATVNAIPTVTATTPANRCGTGTVTLGATASAGTLNWYAAATGGTSLGTGTSFTTPSISATTTYYVDATNTGCTTATRTAVIATVNTIPTVTATTPASICGTGTATLGATASAGTLNWYAAATGGTSLATGTSFTTPSISATTTYYVDATNTGCTTATRTAVIATVNTIPTVTATTPASICGTGTVTIGATASAGTLNWYAAATGGTSLGTGTSFTTPSISATTTYYVDATNTGCTTATRTAVIATVNTIPTVTATTPASICGTGTVTLGATASAGTLNWYASATGGTSLGTGTSFTTPSISATTTYYVDATNTGCTTATRTAVIATVNTIPTVTATTPAAICGTGTATLGATASAGTLNWYASATGGTSLATGTSFTTPSISATTTYYVDATNTGCTTATRTAVIATVNPNLTASVSASASSTSICGSAAITFTATPTNGGTTPAYQWKKNGVNVGTNSATYVLSGAVNGDSVYVVMTSNATPCLVNVTSNSNGIKLTSSTVTPSVAVVASPGTTICAGTSVTFTATATNGGTTPAYQWLKNGVNVGTNSTVFTTSSLLTNDTIKVVLTSNASCVSTTIATSNNSVMTVNTIPTVTATTPAAICGTGTATLGATASAGTLNWYASATGGTSLGTGTSFTTSSISATTTYYVDATNTGCTTATRTAVIATVNAIPTVTATTPANRCGSGTVTLKATASAGAINWYAAATGGTSLATDTSFITPSISATTTYYVDATNTGCTTATRTAVIATVNTIPTVTATTPASICGTGTVIIGATASAGTLNWYAAATGGTSLGTGTSFTTPSISATTTYYVDATNTGCTTATRTAVIATVNTIPTVTATTPAAICGTGTATLGATASAGTLNWYAAATGGTSLGTGTSFTTPSISATTTYYVDATNTGCTTATRTAVVATVNPNITASVSVSASSTSICGSTPITFTATPTNGGTTPAYQWKNNGVNVGTNSATYVLSGAVNGDSVYVVMTSNATPCLVNVTSNSNGIKLTSSTVTPSVAVVASPGTAICAGTSVTFTATATNGGTTPAYQWLKNGVNVGTNSTVFTTSSLVSNDSIKVVLTSNATCLSTTTAASNAVVITVNAKPVTSLIAGSTSVHKDTLETYSVTNTIGSVYNWFITGGIKLSGGTTNSIVVRWDSSYTSGTVKVVETSLLGCKGDTVVKSIISIVPVELLSFDVKRNQTKAELTWVTASELNNDRFEIERSLDNRSFEYMGTVKGHGTTLITNNYNYTDDISRLLNTGLAFVYYRLKQVDYNGKYEYTPTRAVSLNDFAGIDLQVNPNPSKGTFAIQVNSTESVVTNFSIYDNLGMLIWSKEIKLDAGDNTIPVSIEVSQGIYTVLMNNSMANQSARIIIK